MKLEIYGETEIEEPVRLTLERDIDGAVLLRAVSVTGKSSAAGCILKINTDGTLTRVGNLAPSLGFELDNRRIKLKES